MKKKLLLRGLLGVPLGIAIGHIITVIVSLCIGDGLFYPVRPELVRCAGISREEAFAGLNRQFKTHFDPARPTILIFGGSQGARIFNVTCPEALKALNRIWREL